MLDVSTPKVMGIMNLTPDSFYDGGKITGIASAMAHAAVMVEEGVDIIDIGAMSSRPGAKISNPDEELEKIIPVIEGILHIFPEMLISIDTIHSSVADRALVAGAHIINDISAGNYDNKMWEAVSEHGAAYIMMHMQGLPADMQINPTYENVVMDVLSFFSKKIHAARNQGIIDIVIDPGFGFGKNVDQNYMLLQSIDAFRIFDLPVMAGISRKSMVYKPFNINAENALNGTTALHMIALQKGVSILRVHDVKEAKQCIALYDMLGKQKA